MKGTWLFTLLGSLFIIPSVIQTATASRSLSPGFLVATIVVSCLIYISTRVKLIKLPNPSIQVKVILLLSFVMQITWFLLSEPASIDFDKLLLSIPLLFSLLFCAQALGILLIKISDKVNLADLCTGYVSIFILLGISSLIWRVFPGLPVGNKQVVFFSEPSHYVFALTPFLLNSLCLSSRIKIVNFYQISCLFILSILLESVSLTVVVLFSLLAWFVMRYKSAETKLKSQEFALVILFAIFIFSVLFLISQNQYFLVRLNFFNVDLRDVKSHSSNISLLMGYQEAFLNLIKSHFLGVGFQQMGISDPTGDFANLIYAANGAYTNRYEGTILASKIISEFGLAGIFLIVAYVLYCLKIVFACQTNNFSSIQRFSIGLVISLVPYLFVRGGGYFSGSVLISLTGLLVLSHQKNLNLI